jgi:hypothetical protein
MKSFSVRGTLPEFENLSNIRRLLLCANKICFHFKKIIIELRIKSILDIKYHAQKDYKSSSRYR